MMFKKLKGGLKAGAVGFVITYITIYLLTFLIQLIGTNGNGFLDYLAVLFVSSSIQLLGLVLPHEPSSLLIAYLPYPIIRFVMCFTGSLITGSIKP